MKKICDVVREHVKDSGNTSTGEGCRMLGIKECPDHHAAGNIYIAALHIIAQLEAAPSCVEGLLAEYKEKVTQLETENERLLEQTGIAYWRGHTEGRLWGHGAINRAEIERGKQIIAELQALGGER